MQTIAMCVFTVLWQLFIVLLCCSELWQFATSGPVRTLVETATGGWRYRLSRRSTRNRTDTGRKWLLLCTWSHTSNI